MNNMKKILIVSLVALLTLYGLAWLYSNIIKRSPLEYMPVVEQKHNVQQNTNIKKENVSLKESFESAHKRTE